MYNRSMKHKLSQELQSLLEKTALSFDGEIAIEHPQDPSNGDYSTNIAMQLGGNAMENAEKLLSVWEKPDYIEKVEVAPPGFINFWLSNKALGGQLEEALTEGERYGASEQGEGKRVIVEYSSPNIAKRFGIGHLRSTIIGQAIYNLYNFLGYETIGDNHLGDWGTQFGVMLYQVTSKNLDPQKLSIDELEELYVDFNEKAQKNEELWDEARAWFKKLEEKDEEARKIWQALVSTSMDEFKRVYDLLGVNIDNAYGEAFYEDMLPGVIAESIDKGVAIEDQGAIIIKYPKDELPPGIIKKSDGATTYLTRDLATVKFRLEKWNPDLVVYEVGAEQSLHFRQVFRAVELLGWVSQDKLVHVKHGLYLSPGGKKFSTRRGETVKLEDVLSEAVERARKIIKEKPEDTEGKLTEEEKETVAKSVGVGAIKYYDLSHQPASDIVFDWEKIFLLEGNSAPYLQYTHARTKSVLRKAGETKDLRLNTEGLELNQEELAILRTFYRFPEVVSDAAGNFSPNLIANFLFDLAQKYNTFYNKHRILEAEGETRTLRLALTKVVGSILASGLGLLGIEAPEKM